MFRKKDAVPPPKAPARVGRLDVGKPDVSNPGLSKPGVSKPGRAGIGAADAGATSASQGPASGSKGKLAYETRRAEKAGMGLEKWMAEKDRRVKAEREAVQRARQKAAPEKKPGLLRRLLDRAHRPI